MFRILVLGHLAANVLCGVFGLVPGALYVLTRYAEDSRYVLQRSPHTALALFVVGIVVGRLIPWFIVVGRCPDCGGRAKVAWKGRPRMAWRAAPRGSSPIHYRCSDCGTYTETGVSCGPD